MSGDHISANIQVNDLSGQVAVGKNQTQSRLEVTERDRAEAHALFDQLRAEVRAEAPDASEPEAMEKVDELEDAVTSGKATLSTIERLRNWFVDHAPKLVGAVTSVVLSPIVGKLVEAGGDVAASELRRRLGHPAQ